MAESLALPLHEDPGVQGRRHSHPPVPVSYTHLTLPTTRMV